MNDKQKPVSIYPSGKIKIAPCSAVRSVPALHIWLAANVAGKAKKKLSCLTSKTNLFNEI
jgi:hypothetical protein